MNRVSVCVEAKWYGNNSGLMKEMGGNLNFTKILNHLNWGLHGPKYIPLNSSKIYFLCDEGYSKIFDNDHENLLKSPK